MQADAPLRRLELYLHRNTWEALLSKLGQRLLENLGQESRPGALVFACGPAKPAKR
ncbi:MAG TPA: hypothetical protein VFS50_01055 [Meiothermus sp.]|jgi:hypothetical protein|nr:hypothetical protein [Meiothermus sp.]